MGCTLTLCSFVLFSDFFFFFIDVDIKQNPYFSSPKIWKSYNSFGYEDDYSCEPPNFELKFFAGPPPKRFTNLGERELI